MKVYLNNESVNFIKNDSKTELFGIATPIVNINEVPYISTYYIKPVVSLGEDVIINYYITDFYHKEYISDDFSSNFTVTVKVKGKDDIVMSNLKAGDHSVNIGSFNIEGEQRFSIICTDEHGRNSHELFNFFLVKNEELINEYIMTEEDLIQYNIKNNDNYEKKIYVKVDSLTNSTAGTLIEEVANSSTIDSNSYVCFIGTTEEDEDGNPIFQQKPGSFFKNTVVRYSDDYNQEAVAAESANTRLGLQQFLDDKKAEGFNKVVLLNGKYRIDHELPIYIPTNMTVDLNGSTIKLNQFTGDRCIMLDINNCEDTHVINGIVEGDYFAHDYANSPNNSEWVNGIYINSESKYCSYENIVVRDITGYGSSNSIDQSKVAFEYYGYKPINKFFPGDINRSNGEPIASDIRATSDFLSLNGYEDIGYVTINIRLGYQGNPCSKTWNLIAHFYDSNKAYIKSIDGYQYRRIEIPDGTAFMKVTLLENMTTDALKYMYFRVPTHCQFKNIHHDNVRCVGMAQAQMYDMLVEDCSFTRCGQDEAKCAYDAEDGWDMSQDVTFRNLTFTNNDVNDLLFWSGHNYIVENMNSGKIHVWQTCNSPVIRNNNNISEFYMKHDSYKGTGLCRFDNNTVLGRVTVEGDNKDAVRLVFKNCNLKGEIRTNGKNNYEKFVNCDIGGSTPSCTGLGEYINCNIHDVTANNQGYTNVNMKDVFGVYRNCTLTNIKREISFLWLIDNCTIDGLVCGTGTNHGGYVITNSKLKNVSIRTTDRSESGRPLIIKNCEIDNSDYLLTIETMYFYKPIILINNTINSSATAGLVKYISNTKADVIKPSIKLEYNKINLTGSNYIVTGLTSTSTANVTIETYNNELANGNISICQDAVRTNPNVNIIER